ncbi:Release factor glutamine methyltransferase [Pirellulimonas nuda]|uniref:Release factor glutamine methyltransferase n=1 Tax=Pirellulimonas nuda TaxID=2528009 RepID=A0A518D8N7_9BACT|nr:peptide chain release factor N(5)-glutamine methyltransferase [Pirellulimonas nuda]QDU87851.1 Release factor glutamine methyltransferase [Pirellulimonas nuda]
MSQDETWTIGRLLNWTKDFLQERGAESPRLDAEVLLAHARGCKRIELYTAFEEEAPQELRDAFRELVRRRASGTPVAYLVKMREFYSLEFEVTPDVLIPRPETELIVVGVTDHAKATGRSAEPLTIVDVGTGSGVLAVCLTKHLKDARVTALDISPQALAVAKRNAARHGVADRIAFVESDLFAAAPSDARFDYVVSNPPYITTAEMAGLPNHVLNHEPRLALDGGADGTSVIERLLPQAAARLKPGGRLFMEISPMLADRVDALVRRTPGLEPEAMILDLERRPRIATARKTVEQA